MAGSDILHRKVGQSTSQKMKEAILLLTVQALVLAKGDPVVPEPDLKEPINKGTDYYGKHYYTNIIQY